MKVSHLLTIFIMLLSASFSYAGSINLTTYYPSPAGAYDRLRLVPRADFNSNACDVGTIYVEDTNYSLQYCNDSDADGEWGLLSGLWSEGPIDNIFLSDTLSNPNLNVGIGTTDPMAVLHVVGDIAFDDAANSLFVDPTFLDSFRLRSVTDDNEVGLTSGGNMKFVTDANDDLLSGDNKFEWGTRDSPDYTPWMSLVDGNLELKSYDNAESSAIHIERYRGDTATPVLVVLDDNIGQINFNGYDGATEQPAVSISAFVDDVAAAGDMPGRLIISTTPTGSVTPVERMTIKSNGNVGIGTNDPTEMFEVDGTIKATGGLIIENRTGSDPPSPADGQIWIRTDL